MRLIQALLFIGIINLIFACKEPVAKPVVRIIPQPAEAIDHPGIFTISAKTKIYLLKGQQHAHFVFVIKL